MDHIGAAILLPQRIVGRASVEHEEAPGFRGGGGLEHALSVEVADQNDRAGVGKRANRRRDVVAGTQSLFVERIMLVDEASGGVVVLDRDLSARETVVLGGNVHQRDARPRGLGMEIADADPRRLGEGGRGQEKEQRCERSQGGNSRDWHFHAHRYRGL